MKLQKKASVSQQMDITLAVWSLANPNTRRALKSGRIKERDEGTAKLLKSGFLPVTMLSLELATLDIQLEANISSLVPSNSTIKAVSAQPWPTLQPTVKRFPYCHSSRGQILQHPAVTQSFPQQIGHYMMVLGPCFQDQELYYNNWSIEAYWTIPKRKKETGVSEQHKTRRTMNQKHFKQRGATWTSLFLLQCNCFLS